MKDNEIDQLLDDILQQEVPEPDSDAKKNTIAASKAEFIRQNHQAFDKSARPIDSVENFFLRTIKSIGSSFMNFSTNKTVNTAFGTAAVAFVAISALTFLPPLQRDQFDHETIVEPAPSEQITRGATVDEAGAKNEGQPTDSDLEQVKLGGLKKANSSPAQGSEVEGNSLKSGETSKAEAVPESELGDVVVTRQSSGKKHPPIAAQEQSEQRLPKLAMKAPPPLTTRPNYTQDAAAPAASTPEIAESISADSALSSHVDSSSGVIRSRTERKQAADLFIAPAGPIAIQPLNEEGFAVNQPRLDQNEDYAAYQANAIKQVADEPVSTFSIDVDTASYSLIRNQLNNGLLPKLQAVRAEELINYFNYDYPIPRSKARPFASSVNVFESPWNQGKKLVHIGIKGYDIAADQQPDSNIVFLLDVSGSMNSQNKLPLVKQSIALLLDTLKPSDTISIAVYAGAAGTVLEPTKVKQKQKIMAALSKLSAGGSTAGGAGIRLAYQLAEQNFDKNAVNRIILATDGDFNVGQSSNEDLKTLVERKRESGVFLSVLGFGRNNYQDDMMQTLAQNGNGIAAFIDTLSEAKKVLVDEATSTLFPIAKDVKLQVEFNPGTVSDYRLVGYETRKLNREDFNNDKVDAGDIGAGHTVTAIYEITPTDSSTPSIDEPRYAANKAKPSGEQSNEYGFLKIRYKLPKESKSKLIETAIIKGTESDSSEAEFSIAVAGFAQLLAGSNHTGELDYDKVISLANKHKGEDPFGYRSEFIQLVRMAKIARP